MRLARVIRVSAVICLSTVIYLGVVSPGALAQEATPTRETVPIEDTVETSPMLPAPEPSRADAPETIGEVIETAPASAPAAEPVPEGPKRIVVVGDNVAFGVARDIGEALSDVENLTVERLAVGSSGLVRDDFHDWPATLEAILAEGPTTAVVLLVGANDRQPLRDDAGSHQPNSEAWLRLYEARAAKMAGIAKGAGVPLFWVEMPIMKSGSLTSTLTLTNAIFRKVTEGAGGTFVETWDQFADESGNYDRVGPDLAGTRQRLRTGDGVHFTNAGYDVLAHVITRPLRQLAALQTDAARDQAEVEALMMGSAEIGAIPDEADDVPGTDPSNALAGPDTGPGPLSGNAPAALPPGSGTPPDRQASAPPASAATAPSAREAQSTREVRAGRPFLLTRPADSEATLIDPGASRPVPPAPATTPPPTRADSAALPTY